VTQSASFTGIADVDATGAMSLPVGLHRVQRDVMRQRHHPLVSEPTRHTASAASQAKAYPAGE
jgi:hypothetical protein